MFYHPHQTGSSGSCLQKVWEEVEPDRAISAKSGRFKILVGLNDFLEAFLIAFFALIGVRVKSFDEFFVSQFDFVR